MTLTYDTHWFNGEDIAGAFLTHHSPVTGVRVAYVTHHVYSLTSQDREHCLGVHVGPG